MTEDIDINTDTQIAAEAYAWIAQIETGDFSAADRAALREWMNRSPSHAEEIRAVAAFSAELSLLTELLEPLANKTEATTRNPFIRTVMAPLAAALTMVAISAVVYFQFFQHSSRHEFYATAIGEYRTVNLDDGSSIKLNTYSEAEVRYTNARREVRLTRGEAFFDVAKDKSRPFIVYAGANSVRAVGTAFAVRLSEGETKLIVTEGKVEFSTLKGTSSPSSGEHPPAAGDSAKPLLVEAGFELSSDGALDQPARAISRELQKRKLSWTEGLFDFSNTPLAEVVGEVSRYTTMQIEIVDPGLSDVKFSGLFRTGDVDMLLETLPSVGVEVVKVSENEVRLYRENPPAPL